jgi:hypothetical protein
MVSVLLGDGQPDTKPAIFITGGSKSRLWGGKSIYPIRRTTAPPLTLAWHSRWYPVEFGV